MNDLHRDLTFVEVALMYEADPQGALAATGWEMTRSVTGKVVFKKVVSRKATTEPPR